MEESLERESAKLLQMWMRHEASWLGGYLVSDVEDPRRNLSSVLARHFLLRAAAPNRFEPLMAQECRFAAAMNWLAELARNAGQQDTLEAVCFALERGADNAEGVEIPRFIVSTFAALPCRLRDLSLPNYIETFLKGTRVVGKQVELHEPSLDTFQELWRQALTGVSPGGPPPSLVEAACGSANDYRFLARFGVARLFDYTGFDLCPRNVENARALFPGTNFRVGNVFGIDAPDRSFDLCLVHDLFEHLSPPGLETAVREICRVTRRGACIGFFNLDERPVHQFQPHEEYFWNTLSLQGMTELFARCDFGVHAVRIDSFLRLEYGWAGTHNPNAWVFFIERASGSL